MVQKLLPGKDGRVRAARVKVASAERNPRIFTRSVKHLFLLEVNATSEIVQNAEPEQNACFPSASTESTLRPGRSAAVVGEMICRLR